MNKNLDEKSIVFLKQIGKNIKEAREKNGIVTLKKLYPTQKNPKKIINKYTQKKLSEDLNVSVNTISRLERGDFSTLNFSFLKNLSDKLNISIYEIFKNTNIINSRSLQETFEKFDTLNDMDKKYIEKLIHHLYIINRTDDASALKYIDTFSEADKIYLIKKILT